MGEETFTTIKGNKFTIVNVDDRHIDISIPGNATIDKLSLNIEELQKMLESDVTFEKSVILQISLESSLPHRDILMISQFIRLLKRERLKSRNWWQFRKHRKIYFYH